MLYVSDLYDPLWLVLCDCTLNDPEHFIQNINGADFTNKSYYHSFVSHFNAFLFHVNLMKINRSYFIPKINFNSS